MDKPLASVGHKIYRLLDELGKKDFGVEADLEDTRYVSLILHEGDKFKIWAINLGLLVPGHGSLDYRVREADGLAKTLRAFLEDLEGSFQELLRIEYTQRKSSSTNVRQSQQEIIETSESDDDESTLAIYHESIQDIMHRLFRISVKLRNPSTRLNTSRAQLFRSLDGDVDLFDTWAFFDMEHVRAMFQQYRPPANPGEVSDSPRKPTDLAPYIDHYLVKRIARANTLRRRQFAHWTHHRLKLERNTEFVVQTLRANQITVPENYSLPLGIPEPTIYTPFPFSISTATQIQPTHVDYQDTGSVVSVSEYTPSSSLVSDDVQFPAPPDLSEAEKFFQCPYCSTTCSRRTLYPSAWRAHLIHDLRPYVCTYEKCKMPDQLYDSRAEWMQHEKLHHNVQHNPSHSQMEVPMGSNRTEIYIDAEATKTTIEFHDFNVGTARLDEEKVKCPVCDSQNLSMLEIQDHVATHLERLALFSLPRSTGMNKDYTEQDSNDAQSGDNGTRDNTMSDITSLSSTRSLSSEEYHDSPEKFSAGAEGESPLAVFGGETSHDELQRSLYLASEAGRDREVRVLLERGADSNAINVYTDTTPLQAASSQGHEKTVRVLLDHGADVNAENGVAIRKASGSGHLAVVKLLLDKGADVNAKSELMGTALSAASKQGHLAVVKLLLSKGADIYAETSFMGTTLSAALLGGHAEIVKILIDAGAHIDDVDGEISSALYTASKMGYEEVAKILLDRGASANIRGEGHSTALQVASAKGHENIVKMLLDHGADVNAAGGMYGTAVQAASSMGYQEIVNILYGRRGSRYRPRITTRGSSDNPDGM